MLLLSEFCGACHIRQGAAFNDEILVAQAPLLLIDGAKPTRIHKQPLVVLIVRRRVEARNKAQLEANVRQGCPFADKRT